MKSFERGGWAIVETIKQFRKEQAFLIDPKRTNIPFLISKKKKEKKEKKRTYIPNSNTRT